MKIEAKPTSIDTRAQLKETIESVIRGQASGDDPLQILEAGCGQSWPYDLRDVDFHLTGVDMDEAALKIRKEAVGDLDEAIIGDLSTIDLPSEQYDVIYCSYVLEHVDTADIVMKNFADWLKPGGIIIIFAPDPHSVQGFVTRKTPHWFHVLYYRYILGKKDAGKPGYAPYPTHFHPIISRQGMRDFCADQGNGLDLFAEYADGFVRPGKGLAKVVIAAVKKAINLLSLGKLSDSHTNLFYVLKK